jgi:hypothetical protein
MTGAPNCKEGGLTPVYRAISLLTELADEMNRVRSQIDQGRATVSVQCEEVLAVLLNDLERVEQQMGLLSNIVAEVIRQPQPVPQGLFHPKEQSRVLFRPFH